MKAGWESKANGGASISSTSSAAGWYSKEVSVSEDHNPTKELSAVWLLVSAFMSIILGLSLGSSFRSHGFAGLVTASICVVL